VILLDLKLQQESGLITRGDTFVAMPVRVVMVTAYAYIETRRACVAALRLLAETVYSRQVRQS